MTNSLQTVTVNIGRNIGHIPMPEDQWAAFIETVDNTVQNTAALSRTDAGRGQVLLLARGVGMWTGEDGETAIEDAYTTAAIVARELVEPLRLELAALALRFNQECIALSAVDSFELIAPAPLPRPEEYAVRVAAVVRRAAA